LPQSSPASGPAGSPLGRYLLHPGQETATFFHHVLHAVAVFGHVAVPIAGGVGALLVAWKVLQALGWLRAPTSGHLVEVELPPVVDPKRSAVFWRNVHAVLAGRRRLASPPPHVAFEIEGSPAGVRLRFWVAACVSAMAVARAIGSAWPGARCHVHDATSPVMCGRLSLSGELRLAGPSWRSLSTEHASDPLRTVIGALEAEREGEHAVVQILARPATSRQTRAVTRTVRSLHTGKPAALVPRLLAAWRTTSPPPLRPDPFRAASVRHGVDKVTDLPAFEVCVRYGVASGSGERGRRRRLSARASELTAAFGVYAADTHFVARRRPGCRRRLERRTLRRGQVVGLSELAALVHLPSDELVPGLSYAGAAAVAPPPGLASRAWDETSEDDDDWL
jgi:hypothetical protein